MDTKFRHSPALKFRTYVVKSLARANPELADLTRRGLLGFLGFATLLAAATQAFAQSPPASTFKAADATRAPLPIVIVGDSTVANYPVTHSNRGWGQFIGERFNDGDVKVINLAAPGRSSKTFIEEGRWQKALKEKPAYVLIQFGHNDSHGPERKESTDAATDYKDYLRRYVAEARAAGATPILVTPMVRRGFDAGGKIVHALPSPNGDLKPYADAMREVGAEMKVAVIDLHASSRELAEKLGPAGSERFASKKGDPTHFNEKGARAMAELVMNELPAAVPKLKERLKVP